MNLAMNSVGEAKLSPAEINFLQQRANSQSFTWNQFGGWQRFVNFTPTFPLNPCIERVLLTGDRKNSKFS